MTSNDLGIRYSNYSNAFSVLFNEGRFTMDDDFLGGSGGLKRPDFEIGWLHQFVTEKSTRLTLFYLLSRRHSRCWRVPCGRCHWLIVRSSLSGSLFLLSLLTFVCFSFPFTAFSLAISRLRAATRISNRCRNAPRLPVKRVTSRPWARKWTMTTLGSLIACAVFGFIRQLLRPSIPSETCLHASCATSGLISIATLNLRQVFIHFSRST